MGLYYKSTRNSNLKVTASEAILKGLAPDGGLFVPSELPKLDVSMSDLKGKTYQEIAYLVGIDDRYYFSKLFRKITGMSPSEYYKEVRKRTDAGGL